MKNSCSPLAPHPASFAPPWGLAGEVCPSSVRRLLSGPRLSLPPPRPPPLLGSDSFFLSPVPALKGTRPHPRAHARTHSPLTSLVRSPVKPSAFPPHPGAFVRGLGGPRLPHTARDKNPGRSSPLPPGPSHICLAPAVCPAPRPGGLGKAECGGLGKAALCWKGKPDPWRGG